MNNRKGYTIIEAIATTAIFTILASGIYLGSLAVKALRKYTNTPTIAVQREDVIRGQLEEKFIDFKGERYFNEIDERPLE